jgi:hypothetical protein
MTPVDASLVATIAGWLPPPVGYMALIQRYGAIQVKAGAVITPGWESQHMMMAHADWLPTGRLYVNKAVWPVLESAVEACLALRDGYDIKTLGCFSPRLKRVNGDLSTHSWGISVDLNAATNPLQAPGCSVVSDIPDAWVAEFEKRGFTWGGRFSGRRDPMHFQLVAGY